MNTKERIEFLKDAKQAELFIECLKRGQKFEKMWKAFKKKYKYYPMAKINKEGLLELTTDNMLVEFNMDKFEERYLKVKK